MPIWHSFFPALIVYPTWSFVMTKTGAWLPAFASFYPMSAARSLNIQSFFVVCEVSFVVDVCIFYTCLLVPKDIKGTPPLFEHRPFGLVLGFFGACYLKQFRIRCPLLFVWLPWEDHCNVRLHHINPDHPLPNYSEAPDFPLVARRAPDSKLSA